MTPEEAADALERVLHEENAALGRNDPQAAVALLGRKLEATRGLATASVPPAQLERLCDLAAANKALLERAIAVQGQIVDLVVRAVQGAPQHRRYGAAGRTLREGGAVAVARQA